MITSIELLKQWFATFLNAPLLVQFAAGLLAFGWMLKAIPQFPNRWIRPALMAASALAGFWLVPMQSPGEWGYQVACPVAADGIRRVSAGLTLGLGVVLLHTYAIKRAENWIAAKMRERFGPTGDTEQFRKDNNC